MLKQDTRPIEFSRTMRPDNGSILTSGRAGEVIPVAAIPHMRGDAATGAFLINAHLAEMPKPLENAVLMRGQAWFVPRPAMPQFSGLDEYTHAYQGKNITQLGAAARTPPDLFSTVGTGAIAAAQSSEFFRALGIHLVASTEINTDYIDAYNLVQNFRLAAHSSKMTRYDYYSEDAVTSLQLKPAFWPRNRMHNVVADYESALVTGGLDLSLSAGSIPIVGLGVEATHAAGTSVASVRDGSGATSYSNAIRVDSANAWYAQVPDSSTTADPEITANMSGQTITTTLAAIDKARTTNAFAKRVAAMDGSNYSGFNNDDVLMLELMEGFTVPAELWNRPWLVDSQTTVFGMVERHATDAANLDDSNTTGRAQMRLAYNVPEAPYGGVGLVTVEVMPERLYERASDEYLYVTASDDLPSAMRDALREEPVDTVQNRRVDSAHTSPTATFGFEPMNAKWRRENTRLGGEYRQETPGTPSTTARTAIWQADYVDPTLTSDHWLCPHPFPQDVFSVPSGDVVHLSIQQQITFIGLTQFGDNLVEDNQDFAEVELQKA